MVTRLNKFIAEATGKSRREADDLIVAERVVVNGHAAKLGDRIFEGRDVVFLDGLEVSRPEKYTYLALNKPVDYLSSRRSQGGDKTVYDLLPEKYKDLKLVGRLDKNSSGLILLTDDGMFAFEMTHPKFVKQKIYNVTLDKPLQPLHAQMIADFGVTLEDGVSKFLLRRLSDDGLNWEVMMNEGRNRQIRRTFRALGYEVAALHRVAFGKYLLGGLKSGEFEEVNR
jgi:23S rRNA pseudouridine2605 synthase